MNGTGCTFWTCALWVVALAGAAPARDAKVEQGRELFVREWTTGDDRSHGGDGLGPVYNDSSCVACHNAGGTGGGGPSSKNVDIITAFPNQAGMQFPNQQGSGFLRKALGSLIGLEEPLLDPKPARPRRPDTGPLIKAHAGFRTARSVVLHKSGTEPDYDNWRDNLMGFSQFNPNGSMNGFDASARAQFEMNRVSSMLQFRSNQVQGQAGEFSLLHSQRNPTALFGAGLMDSIPVAALEAAARAQHKDYPEVAGRVARQKDGKVGRFGWKAQTPSLNDFVLTACAVELGLEVPDHHQGGLPQKPAEKAKGLDLTGDECSALVAYVTSLPKPDELESRSATQRQAIDAGRGLFAKVGCAACHLSKLGAVEGIYSDLLLHDMGPSLGDVGQYGVFDPNSSDEEFVDPVTPGAETAAVMVPAQVIETTLTVSSQDAVQAVTTTTAAPPDLVPTSPPQALALFARNSNGIAKRPVNGPATRQEWRTPPLWGFRDSGPYLHDGRADTLDQAVALHGGEGTRSAQQFFALSASERLQVQTFLKSLVAPREEVASATR